MWGSGAQTFASEQLRSHGERCYKAPVHCKMSLTCKGAACNVPLSGAIGSEQGGKESTFLLLAAQPLSSQVK